MRVRLFPQLLIISFVIILLITPQNTQAHKVSAASMITYLNTEEERTFKVAVQMEVESSGDTALDDEVTPAEAGRTFVENNLSVLIDEKEQPLHLTTEIINESDANTPKELQRLSVLVNWTGVLPPDGKSLAIYLKPTSEMSIVMVTVRNGVPARRLQVIYADEYSRAENIEPIVKGNPFDQPPPETTTADPTATEPAPDNQNASGFANFLRLGARASLYKTFLPLAFLFSLILLRGSFKSLLPPLAWFLVAHICGILLAAMGWLPLVSWALTTCAGLMLLLSIDNLFSFKFRWWRLVAASVGGFLLGLVIAQSSSFTQLGVVPLNLKSLIPFLLGLIGAFLFAALLFGGLVTLYSRFPFFRQYLVIPLSIVTAGIGVFLLLTSLPAINQWFN
jgi:hypothetical protein